MAEKKTRAPGGGRKPLDPDEAQSVKVMVRITSARRKQLQDLADKHHGGNLSREIKLALKHWVNRHEIPQLYNSALGFAIAVLADRIERITGGKWAADPGGKGAADPMTREIVREHVEQLVSHLLPPSPEPIAIPVDIKEDAGLLLTLFIHSISRAGSQRFAGTVIIDDPGLATILNDLAWHLGDGSAANVETRHELVDRRKQGEKAGADAAWADAVRTDTTDAFADYVQKFPSSRHVAKARARLAALEKQKGRK
jgi:hypothetical protein